MQIISCCTNCSTRIWLTQISLNLIFFPEPKVMLTKEMVHLQPEGWVPTLVKNINDFRKHLFTISHNYWLNNVSVRNVPSFLFAGQNWTNDLSLPSIRYALPHVVQSPKSLSPAFKWSKGRSEVSVVLGIPTVIRDRQNYLQVNKSQSIIFIFKNLFELCEFWCPISRAASE